MLTSVVDIQLTSTDIKFLSTRIQVNLEYKIQVRIEKSEVVDTLQDIDEGPIRQVLMLIVICCASAPFFPRSESEAEYYSSPR